ncbi:Protein CobW [Verticillium dahliae VDG1]|nr:Protein CobW [Verticillium dahliae VDG1]
MSTPSSFQKLMTKARHIVPFLHPLPISPRFAEEQEASPLYSQLPVEVRQMIWQSFFGENHAVHIYLSRKRIRAKECTQVDLEDMSTTPGVDLSGRVVAVGCKVVDIGPGEGVFGRLSPVKPVSLAEYVIAPYEGIVVLPSIAPDFQAADKVFINGGSGGVESFAIQVAKALDCHVTVTCSTDKIGLCQSLGADEVIDYKKVDVMNALYQQGRVFAHVVGKTLPSSMGGEEHRWKPLVLENSHADLTQIARWMEEGKPETMIDQTFALDEVPEAFKRLKKGSLTGKVLTQRQRRIDRQTV